MVKGYMEVGAAFVPTIPSNITVTSALTASSSAPAPWKTRSISRDSRGSPTSSSDLTFSGAGRCRGLEERRRQGPGGHPQRCRAHRDHGRPVHEHRTGRDAERPRSCRSQSNIRNDKAARHCERRRIDIDDVRRLAEMDVWAAIIGKAFYEGS
jgi:hypothetical protein